jgi:c-di-GMP-related signal transduction protein
LLLPPERAVVEVLFAKRLTRQGIKLLAEKVETWAEYRAAADLGYSYFQGYFFCRPETLCRPTLAPSRVNYLRLLEELNRPEIDCSRVEHVIKQEAPLALRLLSYMNSAQPGCRAKVTSIKQAALMLGPKNLRRWANITALMGLSDNKPPELFVISIIRARFCELMGLKADLGHTKLDLFLIGLLSLLDAILDRPLEEALAEFAVSEHVRSAILGGTSPAGQASALARAYECGDWVRISAAARNLNVPGPEVADAYCEAVEWSTEAMVALRADPA